MRRVRAGWVAMAEKRFLLVLRLLQEGCSTSRDIADETGMSVHLAHSYLWELARMGLARRTDRVVREEGRGGAPLRVYEAVQ